LVNITQPSSWGGGGRGGWVLSLNH
jgi:hypothetical protein